MATIRDKFHELGNWHNKISMGAIVTRELWADKPAAQMTPEELASAVERTVKFLNRLEEFVIGADKTATAIKPVVYARVGGDTPVEG